MHLTIYKERPSFIRGVFGLGLLAVVLISRSSYSLNDINIYDTIRVYDCLIAVCVV